MIRRIKSLEAMVVLSSVAAGTLLVSLRGLSEAFPLVAFVAAFTLFMAPGVLASHWLAKDHVPGLALAPVGFALSTGIFGLLGIPMLITHRSIEVYLWTAGAVLAAFLVVAAWRILRAREPVVEDGNDGPPAGLLWAPLWLLGGALAFVPTRRVPDDTNDVWVYLSWVRDFASADRLASREPYFGAKTEELSRVHVNGWLLEQAALARVSGLDPIELVLRYLTPTLVIMALLAVYALARTLFESERAGVLSAALFALFHIVFMEPSVHNIGAELAIRVSEDKHAARFLILPVTLLFAALFVRSGRWRYLGLFAFACWTTMAVHPVVLVDIGLCMLGFGLVHVAINLRRRAAWMGMALLALALWSVVLVPALLLFATGGSSLATLYSADINATPPEALYATVFIADHWRHIHEFGDGSYVMHPWLLLNPVILGTYALGTPFLLSRIRSSLAAQLLLGGLVATTVVVYVPPVATVVGEELVGPGLLWRLAWPIPLLALLTAGWMAWTALRWARSRFRVGRFLPLAFLAVLVAAAAPPAVGKAVRVYREYEVARTTNYHPDPVYPWIRTNIEEPSVLLTLDDASTAIPAYSTSVNVVSFRSEAIISNREALERYAGSEMTIPRRYLDVHRFFYDPPIEENYVILRRHRVDYLMVHAGGELDERLKTLPGFSAVQSAPEKEYSLYAVNLRKIQRR